MWCHIVEKHSLTLYKKTITLLQDLFESEQWQYLMSFFMKHEFFVVNDKTGNNTSIKQKTRNKQFVDRNLCILGCIFLIELENW